MGSGGVLCDVYPAAAGSGSHSRDPTSLGFATQDPWARPFRGRERHFRDLVKATWWGSGGVLGAVLPTAVASGLHSPRCYISWIRDAGPFGPLDTFVTSVAPRVHGRRVGVVGSRCVIDIVFPTVKYTGLRKPQVYISTIPRRIVSWAHRWSRS